MSWVSPLPAFDATSTSPTSTPGSTPALFAVALTVVDSPAASVTVPVAAGPVRVSQERSAASCPPSLARFCSLTRTSSGAEPLLVTVTSAVAVWPLSRSQSKSPPVTVATPVVNAASTTSAWSFLAMVTGWLAVT